MKSTICAPAGRRIVIATRDAGEVTFEIQGADKQRLAGLTLQPHEAALLAAELTRAATAAQADAELRAGVLA